MAAASSIVLSSRTLRRITVRNRNFSIERADDGERHARCEQRHDEGHAELPVDGSR